jgi:hypothetical protein
LPVEPSITGAVASSAGDDFHELWALRQALRLLDPSNSVVEIKVEGVPDDAVHQQMGGHAQAVDLTTIFEAEAGRYHVYEQLKYSAANPDTPWTWARLLAPRVKTKPLSSILGKMAGVIKAAPAGSRASLVSNQSAGQIAADIARVIPLLEEEASVQDDVLDLIRQQSGLQDAEILTFLRAFEVTNCGADSRLAIETELIRSLAAMTDSDARDDLALLQQRMAQLMLPESRRLAPLKRETVLTWLGAGTEGSLFPAPSRLERPSPCLDRAIAHELATTLMVADRPVLLHGAGGCGKTSVVSMLADKLPAGSVVITYDCYGGGLFLASDDRRHAPEQAFVQVANDMAARLCLPFALRRDTSGIASAFSARLAAAARVIESRAPNAVLVICLDAVDNARLAASHWKERCFLDEMLALSRMPANVRMLYTCRTANRTALGKANVTSMELPPFDEKECAAFQGLVHPSWPTHLAATFFDLTGGTPRRLAYAFSGLGEQDHAIAIDRLMPKAQGIDPLFRARVTEAGLRASAVDSPWDLICALANLPRPTPPALLAAVIGLSEGQVIDLAMEIGGIAQHRDGLTFHDEDFEYFAKEETKDRSEALIARAAEILLERHKAEAYAARAIGEMLMRAGQLKELYALVLSPPQFPPLAQLDERIVLARRLALAIKCCKADGDEANAVRLLLKAATAMKSERAVNELLAQNLDLACRFAPDEVSRLVLVGREHKRFRASARIHLATASVKRQETSARNHLRWWQEELAQGRASKSKIHLSSREIVAEYAALSALHGDDRAIDRALRWRGVTGLSLLEEILDTADESHCERLLAVLATRRWSVPARVRLLVAAARAGALPGDPVMAASMEAISKAPSWLWRDRAASTDHPSFSRTREGCIELCEWLSCDPGQAGLIERLLDRITTETVLADSADLHRFMSAIDVHVRVQALRERLSGRIASVDDLLPPPRAIPAPPTPKRGQNWRPSDREETPDERWNKYRSETASLLKTVLPIARAALGSIKSDDPGHWPRLGKLIQHNHLVERSPVGGDGVVRLVRSHVMARAVAGKCASRAERDIIDKAMSNWGISGYEAELANTKALAAIPGTRDVSLELVERIAGRASTETASGTERAKLLMRCSRIALRLDAELARTLHDQAFAITEMVDMDALAQLELAVTVAEAGLAGTREEKAALAGRIADAASAIHASLGLCGSFPWGDVLRAVAAADVSMVFLVIGRWHDIGLLSIGTSLEWLGHPPAVRTLPLEVRLGLAMLGGKGLPDPDDLADPVSTIPRSIRELYAQRTLLGGDWEEVRVMQSNLGGSDHAGPQESLLAEVAHQAWALREEDEEEDDHHEFVEPAERELADQASIAEAVAALVGNGRHWISHEIDLLLDRVHRRSLRTAALRNVLACSGTVNGVGGILARRLALWSDYAPVRAWAQIDLASHLRTNLGDMLSDDFHEGAVGCDLLTATGLSPSAQIDIVLDYIVTSTQPMRAERIYELCGLVATRSNEKLRSGILGELLADIEARADSHGPVRISGATSPCEPELSFSDLLYSQLGDIEQSHRWQASHAALQFLAIAPDRCVDTLFTLMASDEAPATAAPELPFYHHAAREQLLCVALRATKTLGPLIGRQAGKIGEFLAGTTHVVNRELAKRVLLSLADGGALLLSIDKRAALERVNVSDRRPVVDQHWPSREDWEQLRSRPFPFDDTDTIPYWYSRPLRNFPISMTAFLDRVQAFVHDRWGFGGDGMAWLSEPRIERIRNRRDTDHRHGGRPNLERLPRYLEWHGMMCALGEMVDELPLVQQRYAADRFECWLAGNLPTHAPCWLSDFRTSPPLEPRFWSSVPGQGEIAGAEGEGVPVAVFERELRAKDGAIVVSGKYDYGDGVQSFDVSVRSSLISPETAMSLARALQTIDDPMDFVLPGAEASDDIDEEGFNLAGWLKDIHELPGGDRRDVLRGRTIGRVLEPAKWVQEDFGLIYRQEASAWVERNGQGSLVFQSWGEDDDAGGSSGWRGSISPELLGRLLRQENRSLIVDIEIRPYDRDAEEDYVSRRKARRLRLFVIDQDGKVHSLQDRRRDLGRFWVRKEGLAKSVNTLGRWYLHRIAELVEQASTGDDPAIAKLCSRYKMHRQRRRY